ncbi:MAG: cytochrome c biogenesis protein CcdA [Planctomycetota bacterium]|nr:cytochrome c biogenesis protein CcdA [Planctomycetota bacterium]
MRSWFVRLVYALLLLAAPALAGAQTDSKVAISVVPERTTVRPGDQIAIAVRFEFEPGWHSHTNDPQIPPAWGSFPAVPTTIEPDGAQHLTVHPVQWPDGHEILLDLAGTGPEPYAVFEGVAVAYVPVTVSPTAAGKASVTLRVGYQVCDDRTCQFPDTQTFAVVLTVVEPGTVTANDPANAELFRGFDLNAFAATAPAKASSSAFQTNVFGLDIRFDAGGAGLFALLGIALLGGFVLNLTPCVLPVIPLKIMGLSQSAGHPRRMLFLGVVMSIGVITFWLAIAAAMVFISGFKAVNQLFQLPVFTLGVGVFIALMAVGMLGLFTVQLPGVVYLVDPKTESVPGSFLFGVMTAVLSTPCTAPFMAGAVAWSTKQPVFVTLATFGAIGLGMAAPYLVLAAFPRLLARVPKSGPGSELVKKTIGLLMVAVAVFFLGSGLDPMLRQPIDPPIRLHWWLIAAIVVGTVIWLIAKTFRLTKSAPLRAGVAVGGVLFAGATLAIVRAVTDRGPIDWVAYTPERFEQQTAEGRVVVVDFTAEWCLNCKALESAVLHRPEIVGLLNGPGVTPMKVDLTGTNVPGQNKLKELNWVGIPLLAVYGPGLQQPITYDSYTPEMVREAIEKARGPRVGATEPGRGG